jgi:ABC-type spermidine/putrescine transport systems, ATPase components
MEIKICDITKNYRTVVGVDHFSATIHDGELVVVLGPSGCGKSSLLYILAGITKPNSGTVLFDGVDVSDVPSEEREIGLIFQNYALFPHMTVLENICFPLYIKGLTKVERETEAVAIAKTLRIDQLLLRKPEELSGGEQQRVSIARALVKKPKLLLLDEPLSSLDANLRIELREEIKKIQKETGITTIYVTHDQDDAVSIADRIIIMNEGKLIQFDTFNELKKNPNEPFVSEFLQYTK